KQVSTPGSGLRILDRKSASGSSAPVSKRFAWRIFRKRNLEPRNRREKFPGAQWIESCRVACQRSKSALGQGDKALWPIGNRGERSGPSRRALAVPRKAECRSILRPKRCIPKPESGILEIRHILDDHERANHAPVRFRFGRSASLARGFSNALLLGTQSDRGPPPSAAPGATRFLRVAIRNFTTPSGESVGLLPRIREAFGKRQTLVGKNQAARLAFEFRVDRFLLEGRSGLLQSSAGQS